MKGLVLAAALLAVPALTPARALAAPAPAPAGRAAGAAALVERILRAHGGRAALARVTRYRMQGRIAAVRQAREGPTNRLWERGGRLRIELWYPGAEEIRVLRDGAGWRCVGGECEEVSGPMRDAMVLQAARAGAAWVLMEHAGDARAIEPLEFRGRSLPGVEVALGGGLTLDLYADPATHRIAVSRGFLEHGGVKTPFGTNFSDYRSVGGLWFAFGEENFASGAHTGNTTIEKIELNPKPAPNDFSAPVGREGES